MTGLRRAWAWVEHLRHGGTTPWADFRDEEEVSRGPWLPGAIQLEVVRRLNEISGRDGSAGSGAHLVLVDRVLDASAPGRGQPDLLLVGAAPESRFGPRPVDPALLPTDELVRMAVGALAEIVVERDPGPLPPVRVRRSAPWRRGFRLLGDPVAIEETRETLGRAGARPGRRPDTAVLLGSDLGLVLGDVWTWRVRQTVSASWPSWLGGWAARDELPPHADLAGIAARWAERVGPSSVHVVLQHPPAPEVARIVGVRRPVDAPYAGQGGAGQWGAGLSGDAVQVVREVNVVLRVLVGPERHQQLLDSVLLPLLRAEHGPPVQVPERHLEWVRRRAERLREELLAGGYSLHGDPDQLLPVVGPTGPSQMDPGETDPGETGMLGVALRTLLATREETR